MSKLTLLHINLIGAFIAIVVGVALYYTIITGAQEAQAAQESQYTEVSGRAAKLPTAQANKATALKVKAETERSYAVYNRQYMPTLNYTNNRVTTMMTVWWPNRGRSWPERFIRGIRNHMSAEKRKFGVTWTNPQILQIPPYGPDPNTIDMGDGDDTLTFGPYNMVVRCPNLQAGMNHIRSWNTITGMGVPAVEGVTFSGVSPNLFCSYSVRFTIILKEKIPAQDPRITGGQAGGGGPMMGGGMGGPMMGGPSGMGGSSMMGGAGGRRGGVAGVAN